MGTTYLFTTNNQTFNPFAIFIMVFHNLKMLVESGVNSDEEHHHIQMTNQVLRHNRMVKWALQKNYVSGTGIMMGQIESLEILK